MYHVTSLYWMSIYENIFGESPDIDEDVRVVGETRGQRRVVKMPAYLKDLKV